MLNNILKSQWLLSEKDVGNQVTDYHIVSMLFKRIEEQLTFIVKCVYQEFTHSEMYERAISLNNLDDLQVSLTDIDDDFKKIKLNSINLLLQQDVVIAGCEFDTSAYIMNFDDWCRKVTDLHEKYIDEYVDNSCVKFKVGFCHAKIEKEPLVVNSYMYKLVRVVATECCLIQSDTGSLCVEGKLFKRLCMFKSKYDVDNLFILYDVDENYFGNTDCKELLRHVKEHPDQNTVIVFDMTLDNMNRSVYNLQSLSVYAGNLLYSLEAGFGKYGIKKVSNLYVYFKTLDGVKKIQFQKEPKYAIATLKKLGVRFLNLDSVVY